MVELKESISKGKLVCVIVLTAIDSLCYGYTLCREDENATV